MCTQWRFGCGPGQSATFAAPSPGRPHTDDCGRRPGRRDRQPVQRVGSKGLLAPGTISVVGLLRRSARQGDCPERVISSPSTGHSSPSRSAGASRPLPTRCGCRSRWRASTAAAWRICSAHDCSIATRGAAGSPTRDRLVPRRMETDPYRPRGGGTLPSRNAVRSPRGRSVSAPIDLGRGVRCRAERRQPARIEPVRPQDRLYPARCLPCASRRDGAYLRGLLARSF